MLFEAGAKRIIVPFGGVGELTCVDDVRKIFTNKIRKAGMEVLTVHMMGTARMVPEN